jgi:hypothetical protein
MRAPCASAKAPGRGDRPTKCSIPARVLIFCAPHQLFLSYPTEITFRSTYLFPHPADSRPRSGCGPCWPQPSRHRTGCTASANASEFGRAVGVGQRGMQDRYQAAVRRICADGESSDHSERSCPTAGQANADFKELRTRLAWTIGQPRLLNPSF